MAEVRATRRRRSLEGPGLISMLGYLVTGNLCPSSKWAPVSHRGRTRQLKERDELHFSSAVPNIQWASNSHCPYNH